ncbi:MAG: AraC family transcriptional regulator, partial [Bacteroidales bacterium]|nr:AraC family transcriptional regulator [Bacteroidales bacterium]
LMLLLGLLIILAFSHTMFILEVVTEKQSRLFYTMNLMQILSAIGFAGLLIAPHFFPSILYGLPRVPVAPGKSSEANMETRKALQIDRDMKPQAHSYEYMIQIERSLESVMKNIKPFLKNDFNLPQLSALMNIPIHHLSYFFREHIHQSFHDYRNKWRIEHSKMLILDGKAKGLTLEAIGTLSGFSSRNTFFIAFKRAEGISPSEFVSRFI